MSLQANQSAQAADLSAVDAKKAFRALCEKIGEGSDIVVGLSCGRYSIEAPPLEAVVYPQGVGRDQAFTVSADTFAELLRVADAKWEELRDTHSKRIIREMALAIIRITADLGECTDAALRTAKFAATDIERYRHLACEDANDIADRGPFEVIVLGGANANAEAA